MGHLTSLLLFQLWARTELELGRLLPRNDTMILDNDTDTVIGNFKCKIFCKTAYVTALYNYTSYIHYWCHTIYTTLLISMYHISFQPLAWLIMRKVLVCRFKFWLVLLLVLVYVLCPSWSSNIVCVRTRVTEVNDWCYKISSPTLYQLSHP